MAMYKRYSGSFLSRKGVTWRCDIYQEAESAFTVGDLDFPDSEPLVIEWPATERHEPIQSSRTTLKLISDSDREFVDLYSVKPCAVRLQIYRNDSLFWVGTIDTETYEEPYWSGDGYTVTLTFADFGVLDRIPYDLSGVNTLRELLDTARSRASLDNLGIDESLISTLFTDGTALTLSGLSLPSDNFYDEDGEASSWREVLEGMLQPLALRLVQRSGKMYVYDINALFGVGTSEEMEWDGDDSSLSADAVYNNVTVTFSPYCASSLSDGTLDYGDTYGAEWTNLTTDSSYVKYYDTYASELGIEAPECYSWYVDTDEDNRINQMWDYSYIGFTLFRSSDSSKCTGIAEVAAGASYFKIQPMLDGQESSGVAMGFYTGGHSGGGGTLKGISPASHTKGSLAMRTFRMWLPAIDENERKKLWLRIKLPLLYDPRYNPFEDAGSNNRGTEYNKVKLNSDQAFVPVAITVYDAASGGNALYHYDNAWLTSHGQPATTVASLAERTSGGVLYWGWKAGAPSWGDAWLSYYDPEEIDDTGSGILGWKVNRQSFGKPFGTKGNMLCKTVASIPSDLKFSMYESFKELPEGQCIPYPPAGGWLEVVVYRGVWAFSAGNKFDEDYTQSNFYKDKSGYTCYDKIRWYLLQVPEIEVVKKTITQDSLDSADIEYTGKLNADAKEELSIDTICGTTPNASPSARGCYLLTDSMAQISKLTRAGRTDHPEQLLIGTIYSQSAARSTILSGTAYTGPWSRPELLTDAAQEDGVSFIMKSEVLDAIEDDSELTMVEVRADDYTSSS